MSQMYSRMCQEMNILSIRTIDKIHQISVKSASRYVPDVFQVRMCQEMNILSIWTIDYIQALVSTVVVMIQGPKEEILKFWKIELCRCYHRSCYDVSLSSHRRDI